MEKKGIMLLKSLFIAYMTTVIILLILAMGLHKWDLSEKVVQGGIIVAYVLSSFIGGRIAGKLAKTKRFLWGLLVGTGYFLLLFAISVLIYHSPVWGKDMLFSALLCLSGGMLGGMLS